jgi:hypothetical protein
MSAQGFDEACERGERRAQLMARVGDEVRPHLLDALDLGQVMDHHEDGAPCLLETR